MVKVVFLTLLSWSAGTVTSEVIRKSVIPSSHAMETMNTAPIPTSLERHLRSNMAMKTSVQLEEIAAMLREGVGTNVERITAFAKSLLEKSEKLHLQFMQMLPTDILFIYLGIDDLAMHEIFESPSFLEWVDIVRGIYPKESDAEGNIFRIVSNNFSEEDGDLMKMLFRRLNRDVEHWNEAAVILLRGQIKIWTDGGSSADDILMLLKLHRSNMGRLLENRIFIVWTIFVKSEGQDASAMLKILSPHYKVEDMVNVLAKQLKSNHRYASVSAKFLLEGQIKIWRDSGKNANEVYKLLDLHNANEPELFENPVFSLWTASVISSSKSYDEAASVMLKTLLAHYNGDDALVKALAARLRIDGDSSAKDFAEMLLNAQIKSWIDGGKSAEEVYKLLNLHNADGDPVWDNFFKLSSKTPDEEASVMLKTLRDHYKGDSALLKALAARLVIDGNSSVNDFAEELRKAQIKIWRDGGKNAEDVYKLLDLHDVNEPELFENPVFSLWTDFVISSSKSYDEAVSVVFKILAAHYNGDGVLVKVLAAPLAVEGDSSVKDFVTKLINAQIKIWRDGGKNANEVYKLLDLHNVNELELFENPVFSLWAASVISSSTRYNEAAGVISETLSKNQFPFFVDDDKVKAVVNRMSIDAKKPLPL